MHQLLGKAAFQPKTRWALDTSQLDRGGVGRAFQEEVGDCFRVLSACCAESIGMCVHLVQIIVYSAFSEPQASENSLLAEASWGELDLGGDEWLTSALSDWCNISIMYTCQAFKMGVKRFIGWHISSLTVFKVVSLKNYPFIFDKFLTAHRGDVRNVSTLFPCL